MIPVNEPANPVKKKMFSFLHESTNTERPRTQNRHNVRTALGHDERQQAGQHRKKPRPRRSETFTPEQVAANMYIHTCSKGSKNERIPNRGNSLRVIDNLAHR